MDRKDLHLVIISPERTLFDGSVNWVELPGELGKFQVLVNHAPIISSLKDGEVVYQCGEAHYRVQRDTQRLKITGGFVEVKDNLVSYHLFIPDRYFPWFPAIPVFFYLFGLFYINMFSLAYRLGEDKMVPLFLVCKGTKFLVSVLIISIYCYAVQHEIVAFFATFLVFYISFLIFETVYFTNIELRLIKKKKLKQKQ